MTMVTKSLRIPQELDKKVIEFNPKLDMSKNYRFLLELGLKVHQHKTQLERNPELIQGIVNKHLELMYATQYGPELENYLKSLDDYKMDSIKMMIDFEKDRRKRKEERRRNSYW